MAAAASDLESKATEAFVDDDFEPAPPTDPLLHLLLSFVHIRDGSDLTFLLSYWCFRARVLQWPREHARERLLGR